MSIHQSENFTNLEFLFGIVPAGTEAVKTFTIKNTHDVPVTLYVTRSSKINPIYHVFDINKYEISLQPDEEFILKITYSPSIPGSKNVDYFRIVDDRQLYFYKLCFKGECVGPSVHCSIKYMNFYKTPKLTQKKRTFELENRSEVPAIFHFDCNEDEQGVFQVSPFSGTLLPKQSVYVTIRFVSKYHRFYSKQLACLILYHPPILLNLFGIDTNVKNFDVNDINFTYYPFPQEDTVGFSGYLSDSVRFKIVPPPVSLTENYLDFGRILPESPCHTLTTSFTNHLNDEIEVEWESRSLFQVYPQKLQIPAHKSALYECKFKPNDSDRLSAAIIGGHVSWEHDIAMNVPIPITLRFIGHSFPKNQSWIPSVSIIPETVTLPLTLPNFPTWATFMIKVQGHLPVLFKLLPPTKTNFVIKPMIGLIRNYQIFVVQLETTSSEKEKETVSYVEQWNIELNGQVERLLPIYVKAQTDVPTIELGMNGVIQFETMQPGTQVSLLVPMKNISFCHLSFEFDVKDNFGIDPNQGELAPNEEIFLNCWYTANIDEEGEKAFEIKCKIRSIFNENLVIGSTQDFIVTVLVNVVYTELCAIPHNYHCDEVQCGTTLTTKFYLYNFGVSVINFKLSHNHDLQDVIFQPATGRCGPREKIMIIVEFTFKKLGQNTLIISYLNRLNQDSDDVISESAKNVFCIEYTCIYPIIQITDLVEHNFGHLLDNFELWELFRINEINAALREVVEGEIKRVTLSVPDCEMIDKIYYIIFSLRNITNIDTNITLKRRQVCECRSKESMTSLTFRQKVFECPHKELLAMSVSHPSLLANESQSLTFKVKYNLPNENVLSYFINLSNNRTIILDVNINGIPKEYPSLSTAGLNYTLNFGEIFIGLRDAPIQAFWLYNNTSKSVQFAIDDLEITKLCNDEGFPVLKCLNCVGFLKAYSTAPILFRFWPIEVKTYRVVVPLTLGAKWVDFLIEGSGIDKITKCRFINFTSVPTSPVILKSVSLSVDRLIIEPILVSSSTERLFFIKNTNNTQEIKYWWKPCTVKGLVKIETLNDEGLLKPKESHSVVVKITSLNEPCSIKLSLCCEFVNYTQLLLHEKSKLLAEEQINKRLLEFEYSDNEKLSFRRSTAKPEIQVEPMPPNLTIIVPVTVNVIGILDRDTCLNVDDQMKQRPFTGINIDIDNFMKEYHEKNKIVETPIETFQQKKSKIAINYPIESQETKETTEDNNKSEKKLEIDQDFTKFILECIAGHAVFSDYFVEIVKTLKNQPSPVYSQIKLNPLRRQEEKENEVSKFLTRLEMPEVTDIFDEVMMESIHTTFQLGPVIKNQNEKNKHDLFH